MGVNTIKKHLLYIPTSKMLLVDTRDEKSSPRSDIMLATYAMIMIGFRRFITSPLRRMLMEGRLAILYIVAMVTVVHDFFFRTRKSRAYGSAVRVSVVSRG